MEESILTSTKKILGLSPEYTAFDVDIITHINSVFDILAQMGIGPANGLVIEDDQSEWSQFGQGPGMNMVRSYVYLKVRMLFDPPPTSFAINAMEEQIREYEWRLNTNREWLLNPNDPMAPEEVIVP